MNSTEQRRHKRVTDALAVDLAEITDATTDSFRAVEGRLVVLEKELEQSKLALTEETIARAANDLALTLDLRRELIAFRDRRFVGRLAWVLFGR